LFADDTNAFIRGKDITELLKTLNIELAKVAKWFDVNQLCLNIGKTHCMIFSHRHVNIAHPVMIKNTALEYVSYTKFLGVIVDNKLSWKQHIVYVKNKISKCIAILYKVNRILSVNVKLKLYKTFIQPHLTYCNTVWGRTYKSTLKPLEIVQKRAIKMALNLKWDTPSIEVFRKAKVHNIYAINDIQVAIYMFKYNNHLLPKSFNQKFQSNTDVHSYNTRSCQLHHVPLVRLEQSKFAMYYRGVIVWNRLHDKSEILRILTNLKQLSKNLHLFLKYSIFLSRNNYVYHLYMID
jgi:hypothetical protein